MSPAERITDQAYMEEFFRNHLELFDVRTLHALRIWRHDPALVFHRGVILVRYELDVEQADGTHKTVVLRGSTGPDERRQKSYHILKALWHNGFDRGNHRVPQPVGYFQEPGLLLYHHIEGSTLLQQFEHGQDHYEQKIRDAVEWLIHFHRAKPSQIPEADFSWPKHEEAFHELVDTVCKKYPLQAPQLQAVSRHLLERERALLSREQFSLVHGDYQPNNIIITGATVTVIDFNDAFRYDELFDLTYFLTQTRSMLQRLRRLEFDQLLTELESYYFSARQLPYDARARKKLALFRAKTLLSIKTVTNHEDGNNLLTETETHARQTI